MSEIIERELGWDDEISRESDFTIIPEGDYDFTVTGFERGRYDGSEKLPPCNMAIVTLAVTLPDGSAANLRHRLFLHTRCEGLLSAFFTGIGLKRKGEPLRMNWNGEDMQSNDIKKFYDPFENSSAPAQNVPQTAPQSAPQSQPQYQPAPQQYAQPVQQYAPQTAPANQPTGVFSPGKW